jgi:hypothetical protein
MLWALLSRFNRLLLRTSYIMSAVPNLLKATIKDLQWAIAEKKCTSVDLVEAYLVSGRQLLSESVLTDKPPFCLGCDREGQSPRTETTCGYRDRSQRATGRDSSRTRRATGSRGKSHRRCVILL